MSLRKRVWFIVFNAIQLILAALLLFSALITIFNSVQFNRKEPAIIIMSIISFLMILSSSYNLFLAAKYREDYLPRGFNWVLSVLSLCFNGLFTLLILFVMCFGAYEEFFDGTDNEDITGKIMVFVVAAWAVVSILIFIWQLQLVKIMKQNSRLQLETLIDSIGSEKDENV